MDYANNQFDLAIAKGDAFNNPEFRERNLIHGLIGKYQVLDARHEFKKADALEQQALDLTEHYLGAGSPLLASFLSGDGYRFLEHKQYRDAERLYRRELIIREKAYQNRSELGWALAQLAHSLEAQSRFKEAEPLYERALKIYFPASDDLDTRLENLGNCYMHQGRVKEAERFLARAGVVREERLALENAIKLCESANVLYFEKRYGEADKTYKQALSIANRYARPSMNRWRVMAAYTRFLEKNGRVAESNELRKKAESVHTQYEKILRLETGLIYQ